MWHVCQQLSVASCVIFVFNGFVFQRIAAQLSSGVKRDFLSLGKVRLTLSFGFPYEAFGPTALIKPWHILNMVECGRATSFNRMPNYPDQPFLNIEDLYSHYDIFQGSARLTVAKEMYDLSVPKTPLTLEKQLVYVGKSSLNIHTDILLPSRGLTLATCQAQSVVVDRKSRRPSPFPEWWTEKYNGFSVPGRALKINVVKPPRKTLGSASKKGDSHSQEVVENVHSSKKNNSVHCQEKSSPNQSTPKTVTSANLVIPSSDVDSYGHVNWAAFLKYCVDVLMMSDPSKISDDIQVYALKSADISYVGEGSQGQRLRVKFWKDSDVPCTLHFHIVDSESDALINYARLQFYSRTELSHTQSRL